jgi:hypothetical protein
VLARHIPRNLAGVGYFEPGLAATKVDWLYGCHLKLEFSDALS